MPIQVQRIFKTGQAAKILDISDTTFRRRFDSGEIRGYCISGSNERRTSRQFLLQYMEKVEHPGYKDFRDEEKARIVLYSTDNLFENECSYKFDQYRSTDMEFVFYLAQDADSLVAVANDKTVDAVIVDCTTVPEDPAEILGRLTHVHSNPFKVAFTRLPGSMQGYNISCATMGGQGANQRWEHLVDFLERRILPYKKLQ